MLTKDELGDLVNDAQEHRNALARISGFLASGRLDLAKDELNALQNRLGDHFTDLYAAYQR
jgi:hypothetical protein